jgi:FkbM family methyltransferase
MINQKNLNFKVMKRVMYRFYKLLWRLKFNLRTKNQLRLFGFYYFRDNISKKYIVNKGETVLHAGCWQIETVRDWSLSVGKKGKVIIVEANSHSFSLLEQDLYQRRMKLSNVILVNKAIWNKKKELVMKVADRPGSNRIDDTQTKYKSDIGTYLTDDIVQADTISNILDEIDVKHVDHFHLTVNGAEVEAIDAIDRKFLKKGVRLFTYCETILPDKQEMATDLIVSKMKKLGFKAVAHSHMPNSPDPIYGIIS